MADMINSRLAARLEHLQIERLVRVESVANTTDAAIASVIDRVLAMAVSRRASDSRQVGIEKTLRTIPDTLNAVLELQFIRLAYWSHGAFVGVVARSVPRRWMRLVNPAAILVGENVLPGVDVKSEPIAGERLTDEEWEAWVRENVFPPPEREVIKEIVHRPNAGVDYAERIRGLSKLVDPERTAATLIQGIADGRNVAELSQDVLRHVEGGVKASARRIARTEGLRVANAMQREAYSDISDLMIGIRIMETLDQNTRPDHALRHGTIYYNDGRQPAMSEAPLVPDAPNCRGFDIPVMRPPEELADDPSIRTVFQNSAGESIPDPETYSQWWAGADVGRQKVAVGAGRYNAMARKLGDVRAPEWEDFIDADGRRLLMREIESERSEDREKRRQSVFAAIRARSATLRKVGGSAELPSRNVKQRQFDFTKIDADGSLDEFDKQDAKIEMMAAALKSNLRGGKLGANVASVIDDLAFEVPFSTFQAAAENIQSVSVMSPSELERRYNRKVGGFFNHTTGELVLSSPAASRDAKAVVSHEFAHAIDKDFKLSNGGEWLGIWESEMSSGQLSKYGATDRHEGLAEIFSAYHDPSVRGWNRDDLEKEFPAAVRFLRKRKMIHE